MRDKHPIIVAAVKYLMTGAKYPALWSFVTGLAILSSNVSFAHAQVEAPPQRAELSTAAFAHVYTRKQPITVMVDRIPKSGQLQVFDYDGRLVASHRVEHASQKISLGYLPAGYYTARTDQAALSLAVVRDQSHSTQASPIGVNVYLQELVAPSQWGAVANLIRLCGITAVRDVVRNSTFPARGQTDWTTCEPGIDALADAGLKPYLVFGAQPGWMRSDGSSMAVPNDLRDLYEMARKTATHFTGRVVGYEPRNEPDLGYFDGLPSGLAAYTKAISLGVKAGDPDAVVTSPSMTQVVIESQEGAKFFQQFFAAGTASYLDVFNYHQYVPLEDYQSMSDIVRTRLGRAKANMPLWITEDGLWQKDAGTGNLTETQQREQARFISQALPTALSAGAQRVYWFIFPYFRNPGGHLHGLLAASVTGGPPHYPVRQTYALPGLCALATVRYALGSGRFLGRLDGLPSDIEALIFDRGDGMAGVVCWSHKVDTATMVKLPWSRNQIREMFNAVGTPIPPGKAGEAAIKVTGAATYIIVSLANAQAQLQSGTVVNAKPQETIARKRAPSPIVGRLFLPLRHVDRALNAYVLPRDKPVTGRLEVYNFGRSPFSGEATLTTPAGWQLQPHAAALRVGAMGRQVVKVMVSHTTDAVLIDPTRIQVDIQSKSGDDISQAYAYVLSDFTDAPVSRQYAFDLNPGQWQPNSSGKMTITAEPDGVIRFKAMLTPKQRGYALPQHEFNPDLDLSKYDGVRFQYRTNKADRGLRVIFSVVEPHNIVYLTSPGLESTTHWTTATILFHSLRVSAAASARRDPDGRLDLDRIAKVRIGLSKSASAPAHFALEIRNLKAVGF